MLLNIIHEKLPGLGWHNNILASDKYRSFEKKKQKKKRLAEAVQIMLLSYRVAQDFTNIFTSHMHNLQLASCLCVCICMCACVAFSALLFFSSFFNHSFIFFSFLSLLLSFIFRFYSFFLSSFFFQTHPQCTRLCSYPSLFSLFLCLSTPSQLSSALVLIASSQHLVFPFR